MALLGDTQVTQDVVFVAAGGADGGRIASGLQQKLRGLRMLRAIQQRMKAALPYPSTFAPPLASESCRLNSRHPARTHWVGSVGALSLV